MNTKVNTNGINHGNLRTIDLFGAARSRRSLPPITQVEIDRRVTAITLPITCWQSLWKKYVSRLSFHTRGMPHGGDGVR
jgi:hypothetical protein